jgi:hypothetical protein
MRATLALVAATAGLLLAGCTSNPEPSDTTSETPSASASVSSSPTSTLPADEQQAFDEVTETVRAYEQMFYDILADPEPSLNDMNEVATQPQLALDLKNLQGIVSEGGFSITSTGPIVVASAEPASVDLESDPAAVTLVACVDKSSASGTNPDGSAFTGVRQEAQYRVVKTTYLPAPGWAVAEVLPPEGFDQPQPC